MNITFDLQPALDKHGTIYPQYYVSRRGQVVSTKQGEFHVLAGAPDSTGYPCVTLLRNGKQRSETVHSLVARAWLTAPPGPGYHVNHLDGVKTHPHVSNLEWVTPQGNVDHAVATGLHPRGERQGFAKLTEKAVRSIRLMNQFGWSCKRLGPLFDTDKTNIQLIVRRKAWRHVA